MDSAQLRRLCGPPASRASPPTPGDAERPLTRRKPGRKKPENPIFETPLSAYGVTFPSPHK